MSDVYEIRKDVPAPTSDKRTGLTKTIRKMEYMDSIVVPLSKLSSVHPCAAQAGAKVRTQKNADGTVTVWRVDLPQVVDKGAAAPVALKPADKPNSIGGYYAEQQPYGPSVFVVTELDGFGRPVVPEPEPATKKDIFS